MKTMVTAFARMRLSGYESGLTQGLAQGLADGFATGFLQGVQLADEVWYNICTTSYFREWVVHGTLNYYTLYMLPLCRTLFVLSVHVQVGFYLGFTEYMLELSSESQADSQIKAKRYVH